MTTLGAGENPVMWRAASRPSIPGIRISISTTSGRWAVTAEIADSAFGGLTHHGDAVGGLEDDAEPGPDQLLVVDHEDPDRGRRAARGPIPGIDRGPVHSAGSRAVTAKPPALVGPTVRFPPHEATRSAMPARPSPAPSSGTPGAGASRPFPSAHGSPESVTHRVM